MEKDVIKMDQVESFFLRPIVRETTDVPPLWQSFICDWWEHRPYQWKTSQFLALDSKTAHRSSFDISFVCRQCWNHCFVVTKEKTTRECSRVFLPVLDFLTSQGLFSQEGQPYHLRLGFHDLLAAGFLTLQTTYHLVMTNSLLWYRWAIEIDGLPLKNGDFPYYNENVMWLGNSTGS